MSAEMQRALIERHELIEQRADAVLNTAMVEAAPWSEPLGKPSKVESRRQAWERAARTIAAYRDRYSIVSADPLGVRPVKSLVVV